MYSAKYVLSHYRVKCLVAQQAGMHFSFYQYADS